jgi:hypothetical protein
MRPAVLAPGLQTPTTVSQTAEAAVQALTMAGMGVVLVALLRGLTYLLFKRVHPG